MFSFETGGVNQGNVGVKNIGEILIKIPSMQEQTQIVSA
ncbi:restriction endonuclease subunit S [Kaistella anthropi]|nr:restriction endonuclease subunit S [Kaistella anthropi]